MTEVPAEQAAPADRPNDRTGAIPTRESNPYLLGAKTVLPMLGGTALFGLAAGAAVAPTTLPTGAQFALPVVFYTGVAQLSYAQLFALGAPFVSMVLTLVLINLRYMIYAAIASTWPQPPGLLLRIVIPYFVTETSFALALQADIRERVRFLVGVGMTMCVTWVAACTVGTLAAAQLPPLKHAYALPAIVLAPVLAGLLRARRRQLAAVLACAIGVVLAPLPYHIGPLFAGIGATVLTLGVARVWRIG